MDRTIQKALGLQMNGFYAEALEIYQKALVKEPFNILLCEYYGGALATVGHYQEAKRYLKKALRDSVQKPQVLNNLATVNRGLGMYSEGLLNVKSALKFKPDYTDAWINCANLHTDLKQWKDAIHCYNNAIKLENKDSGPYISLANVYLQDDQFEKALDLYKDCQSRFDDPQFLVGELICYRAMKKQKTAMQFAANLKNEFDNKQMWFEWVQTLWMAQEFDKAELEATKAIEKFGNYPDMDNLMKLLHSSIKTPN